VARHRHGGEQRDGGYAVALMALVLLPLLAFAGLAVDLGGWYAHAARVQRAADAASLAGVPRLSQSEALAVAEARRVAALNGFVHGQDGVTVDVTRVGAQELRVTISVDEVAQYLTRPFRDEVSISRTSTSERVMPVPLGSARNFLGTNLLMPNVNHREGFALAMNGYCTPREQGDRITARADASFGPGFQSCHPGSPNHVQPNPEHSPEGYFYAVEIPEGYTGGSIQIQVYDGANCRVTGGIGNDTGAPRDLALGRPFDTRLRVRDADNVDPLQATVLGEVVVAGGTKSAGGNTVCSVASAAGNTNPPIGSGGATCTGNRWAFCWRTLPGGSITVPQPGDVYFVQIQPETPSTPNQQDDSNAFALRVLRNGSFTPCTSDISEALLFPGSTAADCVNVYGLTHLGVFANIAGTSASFYLADIGPQHNGKQLEVTLWDAGEGRRRSSCSAPTPLSRTGSRSPSTGRCSASTRPIRRARRRRRRQHRTAGGSIRARRPST
jgi:Flp pilus assembly protein TadG